MGSEAYTNAETVWRDDPNDVLVKTIVCESHKGGEAILGII